MSNENFITRESRVRHIAQLMSRGEWLNSYRMRCELAAEWGVTESAIRGYSAEAHRLLATDPEERKQLRDALANTFLSIAAEARARTSSVTGLPDMQSALKALELYAKFASVAPEEAQAAVSVAPVINVVCKPDDQPEPPAIARVSSDKAE
jgi:hypothetical protein